MDIIFEIIFDLVAEGTFEASKSKKVPKPIRYILITLIIVFLLATIGLIIFTGLLFSKENLIVGLLFIALGIILAISSIIKFKKVYLNKKSK